MLKKIHFSVIILILSFILNGCAGMILKQFEKRLLAGEWVKDGSTKDDFYVDNWKCQQQSSYISPDGVFYDLKLYTTCMYANGWRLIEDGGEVNTPSVLDKE